MSIINKMLQDLDQRGAARDGAARQQQLHAIGAIGAIGAVGAGRRPWLLSGAILLLLLAGAAAVGWRYWAKQGTAPQSAPLAVAVVAPAIVQSQSQPQVQPQPQPQPVIAAAAIAPPVAAAATSTMVTRPAKPPVPPLRAPATKSASTAERLAAPRAAAANNVGVDAVAGSITRSVSAQQGSENSYRRALLALQEGRVSTALDSLQQALDSDPRNDGARQTLVSLLLEQQRPDEAARQLQLALDLNPRQPALAMVLARLQVERGGAALDTLMHSLPYADSSAEYQAFLAGVLQRAQRHAEAAQYYRAALKLAPNNGVWWMGLGISLQAEQHGPEARVAYQRARAASGLTPELLAFVERKIEALAR